MPFTSAEQYLAANPDLLRAGITVRTAQAHYNAFGVRENRQTTFDAAAYEAANPDLIQAFGTNTTAALNHFISSGYREGRSTTFNASSYEAANPDLIQAFGTDITAATAHFITNGYRENRSTSFNAISYIAANADLVTAFGTNTTAAITHYITSGYRENRSTSFNATSYLQANSDLSRGGITADTAAIHYISYGARENRSITINNTTVTNSTTSTTTNAIVNNYYITTPSTISTTSSISTAPPTPPTVETTQATAPHTPQITFGTSNPGESLELTAQFNGHSYALIHTSTQISWTQARTNASNRGGQLASITTQAENEAVTSLVQRSSNADFVWIGGYYASNNWNWVSGETGSFNNGITNNHYALSGGTYYNGADALLMLRNGRWSNIFNEVYNNHNLSSTERDSAGRYYIIEVNSSSGAPPASGSRHEFGLISNTSGNGGALASFG